MNEEEAKAFEKRKWEIVDSRMGLLGAYIKEWNSALEEDATNFTEGEIGLLEDLAEANMMNNGNRQGLNDNQRKMKEAVRRRMRNSLSDLDRMAKHGFIGVGSGSSADNWNPKIWDSDMDRPMFDVDRIKEDFPIQNMGAFIECLVATYGDNYAIPLVDSIRRGLVNYERRDPTRHPWESYYEIEVPIIRKTKGSNI